MPRKAKYSKEELIDEAVKLIRRKGLDACSARTLTKRLDATQATIFTHFDSMDELKECAVAKIQTIYDEYIESGLKKAKLPFKAFAFSIYRFAKDEPNFYRVLFLEKKSTASFEGLLKKEGHFERVIQSAKDTFDLNDEQALEVYSNLNTYLTGLCQYVINDTVKMDDADIATRLGVAARAFVREALLPPNSNVSLMPDNDKPTNLKEFLGYPNEK